MKSYILATFLVVSLFVPTAWASDDGQTQPRLNATGIIFPNTSIDIVSSTNGVGNVKGVYCKSSNSSSGNINIFVDGGAAQVIAIQPGFYAADSNGETLPDGYRLMCVSPLVFAFSYRNRLDLELDRCRASSAGRLIEL